MKNILAENMIRFGVKNLNESSIQRVKTLMEQEVAKTPGLKLGVLDEKSFAAITTMYGKGPLDYLKANWKTLQPGSWIHMPTNFGILTAYVKDPGALQYGPNQNVSISFRSFTYIKPIQVIVPADQTLLPNKDGMYNVKGTKPVVFNFIAMEEVPISNQAWLQNNTINKIPMEILNGNEPPKIPKSTLGSKFEWSSINQNITYKVGRPTGKVGADLVRYDKLMAAFITDQITKKFKNEHDLLSSETFTAFAKNITPKPGRIEEQWVKLASIDSVQSVYSAIGFVDAPVAPATQVTPPTPAPVNPTKR